MAKRIIETITETLPYEPYKTAEEMEEICCENVGELPCKEKVEPWDGYTDEELLSRAGITLDEQGRDENGHYVVIERLPRTHPCGELVKKYLVDQKNCCDEIEPISILDSSDDIWPDHSVGYVMVSGGVAPYHVSVRGNGFYFGVKAGQRDGVVLGNVIPVYADEACGSVKISITDKCTTAVHSGRSTNGQWVVTEEVRLKGDYVGCAEEFTSTKLYRDLGDSRQQVTVYMDTGLEVLFPCESQVLAGAYVTAVAQYGIELAVECEPHTPTHPLCSYGNKNGVDSIGYCVTNTQDCDAPLGSCSEFPFSAIGPGYQSGIPARACVIYYMTEEWVC